MLTFCFVNSSFEEIIMTNYMYALLNILIRLDTIKSSNYLQKKGTKRSENSIDSRVMEAFDDTESDKEKDEMEGQVENENKDTQDFFYPVIFQDNICKASENV